MTDFRGSILELKENQATVMTDACDFITIKRQPEMFIGQQIKFQKSDINTTGNKYKKYLALVASVFIIVLSFTFYSQVFIPNTVYAYVDVDINPSIEFAIDKNMRVLDIKPLNKDAQTLLKELKLNNLPIKQAITEVVKESRQLGFIKPNKKNAVLVSVSLGSEKKRNLDKSDEKELDNILADISSTTFDLVSEKIKPDVLKVTSEERLLAVKIEISMGRYALYNKMKEKNINISVEEAKTFRVSDMLDKAQVSGSNDLSPEGDNGNNHNGNADTGTNITNENNKNDNTNYGNINSEMKKGNKDKNEGIKGNYNDHSDTEATRDKNGSTDQNTVIDSSDKNNDNSDTGASVDKNGSTNQSITIDSSDKTGDNSDTGASIDTNDSTDQGTTEVPGNEQTSTNSDVAPNAPATSQEPDD